MPSYLLQSSASKLPPNLVYVPSYGLGPGVSLKKQSRLTDLVQLMFSVPLYFQITTRSSNTASGAHLVPAVVGNAIGGVISGVIIKR